jgi:hypothetical protein
MCQPETELSFGSPVFGQSDEALGGYAGHGPVKAVPSGKCLSQAALQVLVLLQPRDLFLDCRRKQFDLFPEVREMIARGEGAIAIFIHECGHGSNQGLYVCKYFRAAARGVASWWH